MSYQPAPAATVPPYVAPSGGGGGGASALDDLTDVQITTPASGHVLRRNAQQFVNVPGTDFFEAAGSVAAHEADTTGVHGIADTSALVTTATVGELVRDTMGAALVPGTGITVTVNDPGDAITIAAASSLATDAEVSSAVSSHAAAVSGVHGISAFGATLVDDADAPAARSTLQLGSAATRNLTVASTAPASPAVGDVWVDTTALASSGGTPVMAGYKYRSTTQYHYPEGVNPREAGQQSAATPSVLAFWPFYVANIATVAGLATWCGTLEAGALLRLGVYASSSNLVPTALVADYGTVSGASTGAKEVTGSIAVGPGWVFLAVATSTHTTVRWARMHTSPTGSPFGTQNQIGRAYLGWVASGTDYTASGLPSAAPSVVLFENVLSPNIPTPIVRLS